MLAGCVHARRADTDPPVGELDGPRAAAKSCPDGATAKGWGSEVWCEDLHGRLQGEVVVVTGGVVRVEHYRDGVADGAFDGPEGHVEYRMGRLEGVCHGVEGMVTFHDGRADGPFRWEFGNRCREDTGGDDRPESLEDCLADGGGGGVVTGVFELGAATGTIRVARAGSTRELVVERGIALDLPPELGDSARDFTELFGPKHRWVGRPLCPYSNDVSVHRGRRRISLRSSRTPSGACYVQGRWTTRIPSSNPAPD